LEVATLSRWAWGKMLQQQPSGSNNEPTQFVKRFAVTCERGQKNIARCFEVALSYSCHLSCGAPSSDRLQKLVTQLVFDLRCALTSPTRKPCTYTNSLVRLGLEADLRLGGRRRPPDGLRSAARLHGRRSHLVHGAMSCHSEGWRGLSEISLPRCRRCTQME
jgi:hypothetical protein